MTIWQRPAAATDRYVMIDAGRGEGNRDGAGGGGREADRGGGQGGRAQGGDRRPGGRGRARRARDPGVRRGAGRDRSHGVLVLRVLRLARGGGCALRRRG